MDDLDPTMAQMLTAFIKDWTDRYPFKAERKGGSMYPAVRQFFITTQYDLEELWPDKIENGIRTHNVDRDAIERRCKIAYFHPDIIGHKSLPDPNNWHARNRFYVSLEPNWIRKEEGVNFDYN